MMRLSKIIATIVLLLALLIIMVHAHSGKTDSSGGHYDHSSGEYHYHHGYPAHTHYDMDGDGNIDCPYDFEDNTNHNNNNSTDKNKKEVSFGDIILKIFIALLKSVVAFFFAAAIAGIILTLLSNLPKIGDIFANDRASIIATILVFLVFFINIIKDTF